MANTNEEMLLPDGRRLCYAEYGDPDGLPVFYFHGSPSSRLEPAIFGDDLRSTGLCIIAPDRPGIGRSDWKESRSFSDYASDITHLAEHLGWTRFALLGNSGGGPYVAACASLLPERITSAVVVSGAWRMDAQEVREDLPFVYRVFWVMARWFPPGLKLMLKTMARSGAKGKPRSPANAENIPDNDLKRLQAILPPADVAIFSNPGRMKAIQAGIAEAMRFGTKGAAWDARMYVRPFGFDHTRIRVPFRAFHGDEDRNVPLALAKTYIAEIPEATITVWPGEGHLSAPCNHISDIVAALKR